jgi:hypothetical protein
VQKYPDISDLPKEKLSPDCVETEKKVNLDTRREIVVSTPSKGIKRMKK